MKNKVYLIIHDIRSAQNVGSIFRTADAVGVHKIFLTGYTPGPVDRFDRENTTVTKASLGAEKSVSWEREEKIEKVINKLKKEEVEIVSLEQSDRSIDYREYKLKSDMALIIGNEVEGISEEILKSSGKIIEIPMAGKKESLNVSVSTGVALYRILSP